MKDDNPKRFPLMLRLLALPLIFLLSQCAPQTALPTQSPSPSTIVLVHGMFGDERDLRTIEETLAARNYRVLSPSLQPSDGRVRIEALSQQLATYLSERTAPNEPIQFIAHSMGGLITLHYLNELGGFKNCRALYTIATPHHGTQAAHFHPGPAGQQMRPGSHFLTKLHRKRPQFPITCYRSSADLLIIPNESSTLSFAHNVQITSASHRAILRRPNLHQHLLSSIAKNDQTRPFSQLGAP